MRNRERVMLGSAAVLVAALIAVASWPSREAPAPAAVPSVSNAGPGPVTAAQVSPKRAVSVRTPDPAPPHATVVPPSPGDVPPEPEVANAPPQPNDAIEEEKPQTARWKLEKTEHIARLLGRDVSRLEGERQEAKSRGDKVRVEQVDALLQRHRVRLDELREEARTLAEAARDEPPEP
ncbi:MULTISPECIES: hypothetical protein [unclassified Corallococcus]|uniref:hypothetical protein n=1 Tax=unclassified Corallococcus TaxID=2685029 RepID=UPI001A8EB474|nr:MULTISPECIES: hypothetical protein [unclassified Corallococcus]MBN9681118.1 hypothetical protein [Corallococcus sp. NCSPR001]WAS87289.1 hypothetical protein O0N60_09985 [Corallococcus sp. NCRR]